MFSAVLTTLVVGFLSVIEADDLPPFLHVCHKDDPNVEQCMVAAVEDLRPFLVKGVPEYNIPSLEPLELNDLIKEEAAGLRITTDNVKAFGCSDFFVRKVDVKVDTQEYDIHIDLPNLRIEADYTVDGKLLLLPIKGSGSMVANVTNIKSRTILKGEFYEKNGDTYVKYTYIDLKADVGGGRVQLGNLFGGDKILNDVINDTINKNFDSYLKELMPVIEKALASKFIMIGNNIVQCFTFKQLFPH